MIYTFEMCFIIKCFFIVVVLQITALKESNSRLFQELQDTKTELQDTKADLAKVKLNAPWDYEPGMISGK